MKILKPNIYYLETLKKDYDERLIKINESYQRRFIWPARFQRALILSLFKNYPIGSLIIRTEIETGIDEIVDGQQRTITILNFINNKLTLNSTHGYDVYNIVKNKDNSEERIDFYSRKKSINKFSDLMERDQRWFLKSKSINVETLSGNENEIKEYFTLIQNQEKVKAGEIASNLDSLEIEEIFNYDALDEILPKIGFNNQRKEIIKMLIADFGYQNDFLAIGTTDEKIISFAKKIDQEKDPKNIELLKNHIQNAIQFLLRLSSNTFESIKGPAKKRFIKLFLLITSNLKMSDYINIEKINFINYQLSNYNGEHARKNPKKFKEEFLQKFSEIKKENFDNFEKLFYLFQGNKRISDNKDLINFWKEVFINPSALN